MKQVNIERAIFKRVGPIKKLFSLGVTCLGLLPNGDIICGAGDGSLTKLSIQDLAIKSYYCFSLVLFYFLKTKMNYFKIFIFK